MTTDTPRTDEILISCPSHLQEVALANLSQDLERELEASKAEVERLRSTIQSFILVSPIELAELKVIAATWMARAEKAEAEVEGLREQLKRAVEIAETGLEWIAGDPTNSYSELEQIKKSLNQTNK